MSDLRLKFIEELQRQIESEDSDHRPVVYDGKKNLFASYELPLGESNSAGMRFTVSHFNLVLTQIAIQVQLSTFKHISQSHWMASQSL